MPGSSVGSLLDCSCVFQESSHVQQSILYRLGKLGSVCLLNAVEGCDGDVDVLIHGIVTHSVAIWHHWTKAHHTVCLGANLDTEKEERWGQILRQTNVMTYNNLLRYNKFWIFSDANIPGWWRDYNAEPQQKKYPWISQAWRLGLQCSASSARGGVCLSLVHELPRKEVECTELILIRWFHGKSQWLLYWWSQALTLYVLSLCVWMALCSSASLSVFCWQYCSVRELTCLKLYINSETLVVQQYLFSWVLHCLDKFKWVYSSCMDCICSPIFKHS